ncbi:MAG: hypothetical protein ABJA94_07175 [Rhodoglobus sp.]
MRLPTRILALGALALLPLTTLTGCVGASGAGSAISVAQAYFAAVASGDATKALTFAHPPDGDDSLLTDAVLAASNKLAPITDVKVTLPKSSQNSQYNVDVKVDFDLGGKPATITTTVSNYGDDDKWLIHGLSSIEIDRFDGLGLTIDGQEVSGKRVEVFPGTYDFALGLKGFTLKGETRVAITESYSSSIEKLDPVLDDAGVAAFREAVRAEVAGCIATTTLAAGCKLTLPTSFTDGTMMTDGTIQRLLTADSTTAIESMVPTLSVENPTLAKGEFVGAVRASGQCTKNGASGTCEVTFAPSLGVPSINMAKEPLTVLWD